MLKRILIAALFLAPSLLLAWSPVVEQRIAKKSASLAPPDLKLILEKYRAQYERGLAAAAADEGSDAHRFILARRSGRLPETIQQEVAAVVKMIRTRQPLPEVAQRLGRLVHLVSDANNPLNLANDFPELNGKRADYAAFAERKLEKFPTVFYGLVWPLSPSSYVNSMIRRAAGLYPLVHEEYFRHGEEHDSSQFDDRSTAFGVASLSYSHAVTDVVNLYYYIWKEAGGDVRTVGAMRKGNLLVDQRAPLGPLLSGGPTDSQPLRAD